MEKLSYISVVLLILLFVVLSIATTIHIVRFFKLKSLQKKRDECDLTTARGRSLANEYNRKINRLMNYAPDKGE